jgi:putative acetyltransferase
MSINKEWLELHYNITEGDEVILANPETIIENGGMVFFALDGMKVAGTCAIVKEDADTFQLIKMGVLKAHRKKGIGELLLNACILEAQTRGAKKLTLETAKELIPAIKLYEKAGFKKSSEEYMHPQFGRKIFEMTLTL